MYTYKAKVQKYSPQVVWPGMLGEIHIHATAPQAFYIITAELCVLKITDSFQAPGFRIYNQIFQGFTKFTAVIVITKIPGPIRYIEFLFATQFSDWVVLWEKIVFKMIRQ